MNGYHITMIFIWVFGAMFITEWANYSPRKTLYLWLWFFVWGLTPAVKIILGGMAES